MSDSEFENRVAEALCAPVPTSAVARERVMARVRALPPGARPVHARPFSGGRHSIVGLALAAGIGSLTTLSALLPARADAGRVATSVVIGDSVVSTLHDTLRLVRLIFQDRAARRVAVVGDFNGWRAAETPLRHDEQGAGWSVRLALHDGDHRYAFVVDGTRWVPDATTGRTPRRVDPRSYGILHVAPASD